MTLKQHEKGQVREILSSYWNLKRQICTDNSTSALHLKMKLFSLCLQLWPAYLKCALVFFSHCVVYIFPAWFCYITLQREHLTISPLQSEAPFASSILTWWYKRLISSWLANVIKTSQSPQFPWPTGTSLIFFFYGCTPCLNWIMKGCYFSCTMKMKSVFLLSLFFLVATIA